MGDELINLLRTVASQVESMKKDMDEKMKEQGKKIDLINEKVESIENQRKEDRGLIMELQNKFDALMPSSTQTSSIIPPSVSPPATSADPPIPSAEPPIPSAPVLPVASTPSPSSPLSVPSPSLPLTSTTPIPATSPSSITSTSTSTSSSSLPSPLPTATPKRASIPLYRTPSIPRSSPSPPSQPTPPAKNSRGQLGEPIVIDDTTTGQQAYERRRMLSLSSSSPSFSSPAPPHLTTYGRGSQIITKMGWREGEGLGRYSQGSTELASIDKGKQRSRTGLGDREGPTITTTTSTLASTMDDEQRGEGRKRQREDARSEIVKKQREEERGGSKAREKEKGKAKEKGNEEVNLLTPLYELNYTPHNIFIHEINFKPITENGGFPGRDIKRHLLYKALEKSPNDQDIVFDGGRMLFMKEEINMESVSVPMSASEQTYMFSIKSIGPLDLSKPEQVEQFLSIKFKQIVHSMGYTTYINGFQFSSPHKAVGNAELWRGYRANIVLREAGMFLKLTAKNRIIWKGTALDFMLAKAGRDSAFAGAGTRREIRNALKDKLLLTSHASNIYSFKDVDFNVNPLCTFSHTQTQTLVRYVDFYKSRHNVDIKEPHQPMIRGTDKNGNDVMLPAELCAIIGLPEGMKLDDISEHFTRKPHELYKEYSQFANSMLALVKKQKIEGLSISNNMFRFTANVLPPNDVFLQSKNHAYSQLEPNAKTGGWEDYFLHHQFYKGIELKNWVVFSCLQRKSTEALVRHFRTVCGKNGVELSNPRIEKFNGESLVQDVERLVLGNYLGDKKPQIAFVTLPSDDKAKNKQSWAYLKTFVFNANNITSQHVRPMTIEGRNPIAKFGNMLQEKIFRCGAIPWTVSTNAENTLIISMEVVPKKDVMAFAAFFINNKEYKLIDLTIEVKHSKQKKSDFSYKTREDTIAQFTVNSLEKCLELNKCFPDNIMIFREGFSKIHIDKMQQSEIRVIQQAIGRIPQYSPKFAAVLIGRSEEVFFTDKFENPVPGTLIASHVTSIPMSRNNTKDEFYLVSHSSKIETTITGTRFVVLQNQAVSDEALRELMYKYCYLTYTNARTSKTPGPSSFVHKMAFQASSVV
eukprot:Phypoly_transcript_01194.p1 GENE.Phypoly_transcript_01194~~Phypoly_transcript_01194.p1  ORF type:complete len:1093 (+),score=179.66 Phypoly_transcript_01194:186-3464(+)